MNKDLVRRSSPLLQGFRHFRVLSVRDRQHGSVGQGDLEAANGLDEERVYHEAGVDPQEGVTVLFLKL